MRTKYINDGGTLSTMIEPSVLWPAVRYELEK